MRFLEDPAIDGPFSFSVSFLGLFAHFPGDPPPEIPLSDRVSSSETYPRWTRDRGQPLIRVGCWSGVECEMPWCGACLLPLHSPPSESPLSVVCRVDTYSRKPFGRTIYIFGPRLTDQTAVSRYDFKGSAL